MNYEHASPWVDKPTPTPDQIMADFDWITDWSVENWPSALFHDHLNGHFTIAPKIVPRLFSSGKSDRRRIPFLTIEGQTERPGAFAEIDRPGKLARRYVKCLRRRTLSEFNDDGRRIRTTIQGFYAILNVWCSDSMWLRGGEYGETCSEMSYLAAAPGPHVIFETTCGARLELTLEQTETQQRVVARALSAEIAATVLRANDMRPLAQKIAPKPFDTSRFTHQFTIENVPFNRDMVVHESRWVRLWYKITYALLVSRRLTVNEFADVNGMTVMRRDATEEDGVLFDTIDSASVLVIVSGDDEIRMAHYGTLGGEDGTLVVASTSNSMTMFVALKES